MITKSSEKINDFYIWHECTITINLFFGKIRSMISLLFCWTDHAAEWKNLPPRAPNPIKKFDVKVKWRSISFPKNKPFDSFQLPSRQVQWRMTETGWFGFYRDHAHACQCRDLIDHCRLIAGLMKQRKHEASVRMGEANHEPVKQKRQEKLNERLWVNLPCVYAEQGTRIGLPDEEQPVCMRV